ncbi:MAG: hypothetical protein KI790_07865 [Cyclobacteriaceae bacterium]|nr:hypothetical protein [Cyclobacteriaceae bacterium HetDA_MAG_MS6]
MKIKKSMLDYSKLILDKVSFDRRLFLKEYRKASRNLEPSEVMELGRWIRQFRRQREE